MSWGSGYVGKLSYEDRFGGHPDEVHGPCTKRAFPSVHQARMASRKVGNRLRVYWCPQCQGYHVTNAEKR